MKNLKYLLALIAVFVFVGLSNGASPLANDIVDGWYLTVWDSDIDTNGAYDTLGAADSSTILTNHTPKFGWEYVLQRDAFTGTGSDSIKIEVRIDCKDRNGNVYQRYALDTMTSSAGEDILIPFMSLFLGEKFDVKFRSTGNAQGAGTQAIINRLKLWRRRAQTTAKSSNF